MWVRTMWYARNCSFMYGVLHRMQRKRVRYFTAPSFTALSSKVCNDQPKTSADMPGTRGFGRSPHQNETASHTRCTSSQRSPPHYVMHDHQVRHHRAAALRLTRDTSVIGRCDLPSAALSNEMSSSTLLLPLRALEIPSHVAVRQGIPFAPAASSRW